MEYKREEIEMKRKSNFGKIVKKVNEEFKSYPGFDKNKSIVLHINNFIPTPN